MILRITQEDKERKTFPLAQIVGRTGMKWDIEVPVDKGWIDVYVPEQDGIKEPYVIEVETGYDFDCAEILRQLTRFEKAIPKRHEHEIAVVHGGLVASSVPIPIRLCVVIPNDFAEFIPLFKAKEISVFLWEGTVEWKCRKCEEIVLGSGPWKPKKCNSSSCKGKERNFGLVGLADFKIKEATAQNI